MLIKFAWNVELKTRKKKLKLRRIPTSENFFNFSLAKYKKMLAPHFTVGNKNERKL